MRRWKKFLQAVVQGTKPYFRGRNLETVSLALDQCLPAFKLQLHQHQHTPSTEEVLGKRLLNGRVLKAPPPGSLPCLYYLNLPVFESCSCHSLAT